jgi:hypothetical protein
MATPIPRSPDATDSALADLASNSNEPDVNNFNANNLSNVDGAAIGSNGSITL